MAKSAKRQELREVSQKFKALREEIGRKTEEMKALRVRRQELKAELEAEGAAAEEA